MGAIGTGLLLAVSLVVVFAVDTLDPVSPAAHRWELGGAILGGLLWAASAGIATIELRALWRAYRDPAHTSDDLAVAWHEVWSALYRLLAKTLFALVVVVLWLARFRGVVTWLESHPLALFVALLDGMAILTIHNAMEIPWRRQFLGRK